MVDVEKKAATKITASWRQRNRKNTDVCGNLLTQQGTLIFCAFISIFVFNFFYIFIHYYLWIFRKHLYCDESNCCFCFFFRVAQKDVVTREKKSAFRSNVDLRIVDANDVRAWAKKCDTHKHTWHTMALKKRRNNRHEHKTIKLNCVLFFAWKSTRSYVDVPLSFATKLRTTAGCLKCFCQPFVYIVAHKQFGIWNGFWWNQITISLGISIFRNFLLLFIQIDRKRFSTRTQSLTKA